MNLLKNIFAKTSKITIPKDNAQTVTIAESWTISWEFYILGFPSSFGDLRKRHKVFISEVDADEFRKQLRSSAEFIGTYISTDKYKN